MTDNRVVIFMSGGCYDDYASHLALNIEVFDHDDFNEDPITYWDNRTDKHLIEKHAPEAYANIMETYNECKARRAELSAKYARRAESVRNMN